MPPKKSPNLQKDTLDVQILEEPSSSGSTMTQTETRFMEKMFSKLDEISGTLKEILQLNKSQANKSNKQDLTEVLTTVKTAIETINTNSTRSLESDNTFLESEALNVKQAMTQTWSKTIDYRKQHYWQHIRNKNLAEVYARWSNTTPFILPAKLQMRNILEEPVDQRQRREKQVLDSFKTERELLQLRADSHLQKYSTADDNMIGIIREKCKGQKQEYVIRLWNEEVKNQERISCQLWEKKNKTWLEKYEQLFKTKYESSNPFIKDGNIEIESETTRPIIRQHERQPSRPIQQHRNNFSRRSYANATKTTFHRDSRNNYNTYNDRTTYIGKHTNNGNTHNNNYTQPNNYNNTNRNVRFPENTNVRNYQNRPQNYWNEDLQQNRNNVRRGSPRQATAVTPRENTRDRYENNDYFLGRGPGRPRSQQ